VLVWNYHDADVAAPAAAIHLTIDGLRGRSAQAVEFRMDELHSNAYRAWRQMGSPAHPSAEQARQLQEAGQLAQSQADHSIPVRDGESAIDLELPRQGVALIRVREQ
jgi:xylan 1,4-beta-xylosidase